MPRYAQGADLPQAVAGLVDSVGANRARLAIVLYLQAHPDATRGQVTEAMGIGHQTVYSHLKALEQAGVVVGDVPDETRAGRTVRYRLQAETVRTQLRELLALLDG